MKIFSGSRLQQSNARGGNTCFWQIHSFGWQAIILVLQHTDIKVTRKCHLFGTVWLDCPTLFANFSILKYLAFSFPAVRSYHAVLLPQNYCHPVAGSSSGKTWWNGFQIIFLQSTTVVFLTHENFRWFFMCCWYWGTNTTWQQKFNTPKPDLGCGNWLC